MPAEDKDGLTMYYTSTIVNEEYLDQIMGYGEQVATIIEASFVN